MTKLEAIAFFMDMDECTHGASEPIQMAIKALEQDAIHVPEGATNGEVAEKIFGKDIYCTLIRMMYVSCCEKLKKWWNAPYKGNLSEKPTGSESEDV